MFGNKRLQKQIDQLHTQMEGFDNNLTDSFSNVKNDTKQLFEWVRYFYDKQTTTENSLASINSQLSNLVTKAEIKQLVDYFYSEQQRSHQNLLELQTTVKKEFEDLIGEEKNAFQRLGELGTRMAIIESRQASDISSFNRKIEELRDMVAQRRTPEIINLNPEFHPTTSHLLHLQERLEQLEQKRLSPNQPSMENIHEVINEKIKVLEEKVSKKPNLKEKMMSKISRRSKEYVKSMVLSLIRKYNNVSALQLREIMVEEQGILSKSSFYRLLEEIEKSDEVAMTNEGKEKIFHYILHKHNVA